MGSIHARLLAALLLTSITAIAPFAAKAAESYDNCTGFIDSIPTTVSTQGVWCLRANLSTAITTGAAITIAANNVTIDCNEFKLGGLAGGLGTEAYGVFAVNRLNAIVRRCNVRGFYYGIYLVGTAGGNHLVEDNRLDGNTRFGLGVNGDGNTVRRNLVLDTGNSTLTTFGASGIYTFGATDVLDNTVNTVVARSGTNYSVVGIQMVGNNNGTVRGNRIRGLAPDGTGRASGIVAGDRDARISVRDNEIFGGDGLANSFGISCPTYPNSTVLAAGNLVSGFTTAIQSCGAADNYIVP